MNLAGWALLVSIVALFLPFFHTAIWEWMRRPTLTASVEDAHSTTLIEKDHEAPCLFFRLIVTTHPRWSWIHYRSPARDVEVFAETLFKVEAGIPHPIPNFPSMNLKWSHVGVAKQDVGRIPKYCDIGRLTGQYSGDYRDRQETVARTRAGLPETTCMLTIETEVKPNHARHVLAPGTYHLAMVIESANAPLAKLKVGFTFNGDGYTNLEAVGRGALAIFTV